MNAIVLREPGKLELIQINPDTTLKPDEAFLKVHSIGICGTDLHAFKGNQPFFSYPRILGHELGVEVLEIGKDVKNIKVGDKCSVEPYFNRKEDQAVRRGKTNCGENISVFGVHEDGGMREYIRLQAKYLHKSLKLDYDQLALVEPLGIGCHAVNRASIEVDDKILIIGAGPIGLSAMQFATIKKAKVVAMDINDERLNFCRRQMKVDGTVNARSKDVVQELREYFDGDLPTVVMDATGNPHSMKSTFDYVAHGGKIVFIGLFQGDFTFFDPLFHKKEVTLLASRNALGEDFDQVIKLMEEGVIDTNPWITHRIPFAGLIGQFETFFEPEARLIKALVKL